MSQKKSLRTTILVYSPHGNTIKVAESVKRNLNKLGVQSRLINLTGKTWDEISDFDCSKIKHSNLHLFAFPVYAWKIIEPMEIFLSKLPAVEGKHAGILVTYGGCTSGRALLQAGKLLIRKGYKILGAAKIVASHANVREGDKYPFVADPDIYSSHPDEKDMEEVKSLVKCIIKKLKYPDPMPISTDLLKPQFGFVRFLLKSPIAKRYSMSFPPGISFNKEKCIQCGKCAKACPVNIIELNPYPERNGKCIKCHNCKHVCTVGAISSTGVWRKIIFHFGLQKIHESTVIKGEKPMTQIFV